MPKLIKHANHIVVVHAADHADLIDPITGRWQTFTTQRAAKWSATVYSRLRQGFGHHVADDLQLAKFAESFNMYEKE
jgi:hypothetical protein